MKGFIELTSTTLLIIAIAALIVGPSLVYSIMGTHSLCSETPLDPYCVCPDDEEQIAHGFVLPRHFCEKIDKVIDPDDPDFYNIAVGYARTNLRSLYPDCGTIDTCPGEIQATIGVNIGELDRDAFVVCKGAHVFWEIWIDLEDGQIFEEKPDAHFCYSEDDYTEPDIDLEQEVALFKEKCNTKISGACRLVRGWSDNYCNTEELVGQSWIKVKYNREDINVNNWMGCGHYVVYGDMGFEY